VSLLGYGVRGTVGMKFGLSRGSILVAVLSLAIVACGLSKKAHVPLVGSRTNTKFTIEVVVSESANQNSPIPVDFVMVEDKKLLAEVAKLSAKDWFDRRTQVERDFPTKIHVLSWEWVPGAHAGPIDVDISKNSLAAFLFANYTNGGEHRAAIDLSSPAIVNLGADDFSVQRLK
jgi:type VI secretion system protein